MSGTLLRRGQMQSMEMIIVLIFVALIAGVVGIFWVRHMEVEMQALGNRQADAKTVQVAKRLSTFAMLRCDVGNIKEGCVDVAKVQAFGRGEQTRNLGYGLFTDTSVTLIVPTWQEEYLLYEGAERESISTLQYPVVAYDPVRDWHAFGYWQIAIPRGGT